MIIVSSDVSFWIKGSQHCNVYTQKNIVSWCVVAPICMDQERPVPFLWDCLAFITISILVYNRDSWKQPKPFYGADNKASLVWISWVTLFSRCLLRAPATSSTSAWRKGKGKGRGQWQTRLWGARPAIQNLSCFQSTSHLTPVTYISHTLK